MDTGTRTILAALLAAAGLGGAAAAGAGLGAALMAFALGAAAGALLLLRPGEAPPPPSEEEAPALPSLAQLIEGVDEPLLLVRDRRVQLANSAARALLGDHIEGSDARVAIRHPAAAERLAAGPGDEAETVELAGLGDPDQHWELKLASLGDGSRLVRLADRSQARAAERMRADFVANASHELRTPLATLLGFLETIEDESVDAATRTRFVKIMAGEAARMRDLIEDLMSLSRIEAERFAVPREPVDLVLLAQSVAREQAPLAARTGNTILVQRETEDATVPGDRAQLAQLLANLVTNAVRYGRADSEVIVRIEDSPGGFVRLRVIDRGEGIAREHIPRLTERFYRVDPGRSRAVGGTGLGLAIAKHIVLRHRGRLEIVSKPGQGTSVRIYLPRAAAPQPVIEPSSG